MASVLTAPIAVAEPGAWAMLPASAIAAYVGMALAWRFLVPSGTATILRAVLAGAAGALVAYPLLWTVIGLYQWAALGDAGAMGGMMAMGAIGFLMTAPLVLLAGAGAGLLARRLIRPSADAAP